MGAGWELLLKTAGCRDVCGSRHGPPVDDRTTGSGSSSSEGPESMAIEVETKDCSMLGDAEIEEMAELCEDGPNPVGIGRLSKQSEDWVLATTAREAGRLKGFAFCTLERIGGTPSVIVGVASIRRTSKRDTVLRALMSELLRRAVLAFPDEDVVVGTRLNDPSAFEAYRSLLDVNPRPGHKASGEERAWGRRFAKRFGLSSFSYDEHAYRWKGSGEPTCVFDHCSLHPEKIDDGVVDLFAEVDVDRGDCLVACGWALVEDLEKLL